MSPSGPDTTPWAWRLTAVPQVVVGFVEPILTRRVENIQVDGVFLGPGFVRHIWRNAQHFSGAYYNFRPSHVEFQRPCQDIGDLLVVMVMQRNVRTLFHQY